MSFSISVKLTVESSHQALKLYTAEVIINRQRVMEQELREERKAGR